MGIGAKDAQFISLSKKYQKIIQKCQRFRSYDVIRRVMFQDA